MNSPLLKKEIQDFIDNSLTANFSKIALMKNPFPEIKWNTILNQIASKNKAKDKLPTWFNRKNIIYPSKVSIEQSSSERVARYKASLIDGVTLIDLTGGFGVDDYYFAQKFNKVIHCEINAELSDVVKHNFQILNQKNIECQQGDSLEILKKLKQKWDWIYIDPSRRNDLKGKVFMLKDCLPNVPNLLDSYFTFSDKILIKTAPILDITSGIHELKHIKAIFIIALDNEVKEVLWKLETNYNGPIAQHAVSILKNSVSVFTTFSDTEYQPHYSLPKKYLYEPNAAIMKIGAFAALGHQYHLEKLHLHSHLFTSNSEIDFPGRKFIINQTIPFEKNAMKNYLANAKMNITTRNFPVTVEEIRKKWKIKEGGNDYAFFTTDLNNDKIVLLCEKLN